MDSGVDSHMTFDGNCLSDYKEFSVPRWVSFYNGTYAHAIGIGHMTLKVTQNDIISYIDLSDCLHVPVLPCHVMSVGTLVANGSLQAEFCGNSAYVMSNSGQVILCGHKINGICQADAMVMHPAKSSSGSERGQHSFASKSDSLASNGYSKAMGSGDVSFIVADNSQILSVKAGANSRARMDSCSTVNGFQRQSTEGAVKLTSSDSVNSCHQKKSLKSTEMVGAATTESSTAPWIGEQLSKPDKIFGAMLSGEIADVPLLYTHFDHDIQRDTTVLPGGGQSFESDNHLCQDMDICESLDSSIGFTDFVELLHSSDNGQVVNSENAHGVVDSLVVNGPSGQSGPQCDKGLNGEASKVQKTIVTRQSDGFCDTLESVISSNYVSGQSDVNQPLFCAARHSPLPSLIREGDDTQDSSLVRISTGNQVVESVFPVPEPVVVSPVPQLVIVNSAVEAVSGPEGVS